MKRSILHIITGLEDGGAEAVLYRLVTNDRENQHTVISLMHMGKYGNMLEQQHIRVHCLHMPKGGVTFRGLFFLYKLVRDERPELVQTWMYHADLIGGIAARLAGVKKLYWCVHNSNLSPKLISWTTTAVSSMCAVLSYIVPKKIISCAQKAKEVHIAAGYSAKKFQLVPNGYDLTKFRPDPEKGRELRTKLGIPQERFLMGMVARFDPQKDIPNMAKTLGTLKNKGLDFHLVLVGQGMDNTNDELMELLKAEDINGNVMLTGPSDDIPGIMNAIDVLLLTSNGEAFPNVLSEAMACGTPCVSTDVGDAAMIIGGHGWLAPARSAELLSDAVMQAFKIWQDKSKWHQLQLEAREHIRLNFGIEKMIEGYHRAWGI